MAISQGKSSITLDDILSKVSEADILYYYLGISTIPCVIQSPLRKDNKPSFGLYSTNGKKIYYRDFSTRDRGGLFDLLCQIWHTDYIKVLERISKDIPKFKTSTNIKNCSTKIKVNSINNISNNVDLQCKVRNWRNYDITYWESYGIGLHWLKYADVYPISHKIIIKDGNTYTFSADKYAYAYVERKEGKVTLKIYQPFNKDGYKWSNKHDSSVLSLWTKVPKEGDKLCICSSLKDALCLWANTSIPAIAVQGEGYNISNTAINELKQRYKSIYILFDNDDVGLLDGLKLSESTGFTNIVLPKFDSGKDISDYYQHLNNKELFKAEMLKLFK